MCVFSYYSIPHTCSHRCILFHKKGGSKLIIFTIGCRLLFVYVHTDDCVNRLTLLRKGLRHPINYNIQNQRQYEEFDFPVSL